MNSFKLQKFLKELSDVDLVSYTDVDNFQFNSRWVTDINRKFYDEIASGIVGILQENLDKSQISEVKTLLMEAKQKTLKKWIDVTTGSIETHTIIKHTSTVQPKNSTLDFLNDKEQEERKRVVFDTVIELLKLDSDNFKEGDLHSYLLSSEDDKLSRNIKFYYTFGHLYYVLSLKVEVIDNLLNHIKEFYNLEKSIMTQEVNNSLYSININLTKKDVAILFHTFHKLEIIKTDVEEFYDSQKNLKNWIDNSNIYYSDKGKKVKVKSINKSFSELNNKNWDKDEIKFIENNLIPKLNSRLRILKERND